MGSGEKVPWMAGHGGVMELNSWGTGSTAHKAYHARSLAQSLVWVQSPSLLIDVKLSGSVMSPS